MRLGRLDYFAFLVLPLVLIVSGVTYAVRRSMWLDELFSYMIITQSSLADVYGMAKQIIGTVPLYYVAGWLWSAVFGDSELALRLFSTALTSASVLIVYLRLRHHYAPPAALLGVGSAFFLSHLVLHHNVEVRFYALYLLISAVAFYSFEWFSRPTRHFWPRCLALFALTFLWVLDHLIAVYYSAAFVAAIIFIHLMRRSFHPLLYLAVPLAWLAVALLWSDAFIAQNAPATYHSKPPSFNDLFVATGALVNPLYLTISFFMGAYLLLDIGRRTPVTILDEPLSNGRARLFTLAFAFLLVPCGGYLVAHLVEPVFEPRYFIPSVIGYAVLITHLIHRYLLPRLGSNNVAFQRIVLCGYFVCLCAVPIIQAVVTRPPALRGTADASFDPSLPMIVEEMHDFAPRAFYAGDNNRYRYVLDLDTADQPGEGVDTYDRYYAALLPTIRPRRFFIIGANELPDEFFVINSNSSMWMEQRLVPPTWTTKLVGTTLGSGNERRYVYKVTRARPALAPEAEPPLISEPDLERVPEPPRPARKPGRAA